MDTEQANTANRKQAETNILWQVKMSDIASASVMTAGSFVSYYGVPSFVPGRFSVWLFAEHQRKHGYRVDDGRKGQGVDGSASHQRRGDNAA